MTKFEPADKARGSRGAGPVESRPEPPRGSSNASPEPVAEILGTTNQLLQAVLQLLQRGPESQGGRGEEKQLKKDKRVKEGVGTASIACQTDPEKGRAACQAEVESAGEEVGCTCVASQTSFGPEEAEDSGAICGVAQLRVLLEEGAIV